MVVVCVAAWQLAGHSLDLNTPLPPELMLQPQLMHHIAGERSGHSMSKVMVGRWSGVTVQTAVLLTGPQS